jgi:hypothetical protein
MNPDPTIDVHPETPMPLGIANGDWVETQRSKIKYKEPDLRKKCTLGWPMSSMDGGSPKCLRKTQVSTVCGSRIPILSAPTTQNTAAQKLEHGPTPASSAKYTKQNRNRKSKKT